MSVFSETLILPNARSSVSPVLAVSTSAPAIKSFDVASGASLGDVAARHPGTVTDLGFAEAAFGGAGPGKEVLLSSSSESAVYVWDARARSQAGVFPAHGGAGELWSCSGGGGSTGHLLAAGANSQVRRAPTPPRPPHKSALHLAGAFPAPRMGDQASCGAAEGGTQSTCWRQGATHRAPAGGGRQLPGEALTGGGGIWQTVGTILQRGRGVYRAPAGGGGGIWQILLWDMRSTRLLGRLEDAHTDDVTQVGCDVTQVRFHPLHRTALLSAALDGLICRFDLSPHHEASLSASAVTTPAATAAAERYADSDPLHPGTSISRIGFFGPSASALWCLTSVETLSLWDLWAGDPIASFDNIRSTLSEKWPLQVPVDYLISCDYSPSPTPRLRLFAGSHLGHAAAFPISLPHTVSNPSQPSGPATAAAAAARNDDDDAMMSEDPLGSRVSVPPGSCQVSGPDMLLSGAHSGVVRDVGRVALPPSHAGTAVAYWTGGEDGCLCQWEGIEGQEEGVEGEGVKGRVVRDVGRVALPAPHAGTAVAYWTGGEDGCLQYTSLHYTDMLLSGAHSGVVRDVGRVALPASHAAVSGGMAVAFWTGGKDGVLALAS
ncbi:unnamed protein product [Closterium sp. NIES-64]|nr:unnamed protein product [Closterium sp. NIES-64]